MPGTTLDAVRLCLKIAQSLTKHGADTILPPMEVLTRFEQIQHTNTDIKTATIGHDRNGNTIPCYIFPGSGKTILLYAFPDPAEALGGTASLCLLQGLLSGHPDLLNRDWNWHFIPCLNLPDQPDCGNRIAPAMRRNDLPEVDWCVNQPRPETSALMKYAAAIQPAYSFPLHDESHTQEHIPAYFFSCEAIDIPQRSGLKWILNSLGIPHVEEEERLFFDLQKCSDYGNSTFSKLAEYGKVFCTELPGTHMKDARILLTAQLACLLFICEYGAN